MSKSSMSDDFDGLDAMEKAGIGDMPPKGKPALRLRTSTGV